MQLLSIQLSKTWSWGLIVNYLLDRLHAIHGIFPNIAVRSEGCLTKAKKADVILSQQVSILDSLQTEQLKKTICRIGSVRCLEDRKPEELAQWKRNLSRCAAIIATNQYLYDFAKQINPNTYLIPNGIPLEMFKPKPFTVGFCGNISKEFKAFKGYPELVEACKRLNIQLLCALYENNQIPHADMPEKFYHRIDCLVHPTTSEGCSNTLMEACACGVPIITTKSAGFHGDFMQHGENVFFCEKSIESIVNAIKTLMEDDQLRKKLAINARKFAEKYHNVNQIAMEYSKIIKDVFLNKK